jgi:hypothetical protein
MRTERVHLASAFWLAVASGGLILWSSAFVLLYAALGVGCALGWQLIPLAGSNVLTIVLAAIWLVHLALLGAFQWYAHGLWRRASGPDEGAAKFLAGSACLIAAIGIFATVFIGFAVLLLPPCA